MTFFQTAATEIDQVSTVNKLKKAINSKDEVGARTHENTPLYSSAKTE
jgi:hypothetical protein